LMKYRSKKKRRRRGETRREVTREREWRRA
jgi:hypothetical protein